MKKEDTTSTTREDALNWWENTHKNGAIRVEWKTVLCIKYFGWEQDYTRLTDEQIEFIYKSEYPENKELLTPVSDNNTEVIEVETTDEKVKVAIEQYNRKAKLDDRINVGSYHYEFFRTGYIYGIVRANEEGCIWGLNQNKEQAKELKGENERLKEQIEVMKHNNKTACILAMEWGYKQCEKGENMNAAFLNYNNLLNSKR